MTKLTKEEALGAVGRIYIDDKWNAMSKTERLAALGFILIPIEPSEETIEAMAKANCVNPAWLPLYRHRVERVYAALVKHERGE